MEHNDIIARYDANVKAEETKFIESRTRNANVVNGWLYNVSKIPEYCALLDFDPTKEKYETLVPSAYLPNPVEHREAILQEQAHLKAMIDQCNELAMRYYEEAKEVIKETM